MLTGYDSWRRATDLAFEFAARSTTGNYRYRVVGYQLSEGVWAYEIKKLRNIHKKLKEVLEVTKENYAELTEGLPHCAQRARIMRGGRFKMAIPNQQLAEGLAKYHEQGFYKCTLSAPAIGPHWHLKTKKKKVYRI